MGLKHHVHTLVLCLERVKLFSKPEWFSCSVGRHQVHQGGVKQAWQFDLAKRSMPAACLQIQYHEPTPPETPLKLVSRVVAVEQNQLTGKHKVTVDLALSHQIPGDVKKILVSGRGIFTKRGASRSL